VQLGRDPVSESGPVVPVCRFLVPYSRQGFCARSPKPGVCRPHFCPCLIVPARVIAISRAGQKLEREFLSAPKLLGKFADLFACAIEKVLLAAVHWARLLTSAIFLGARSRHFGQDFNAVG